MIPDCNLVHDKSHDEFMSLFNTYSASYSEAINFNFIVRIDEIVPLRCGFLVILNIFSQLLLILAHSFLVFCFVLFLNSHHRALYPNLYPSCF